MPTIIQETAPETTLENGRQIFQANDETLKNAVNSLESQAATHVGSGDHDGRYYLKSEVDIIVANASETVDEATITRDASGNLKVMDNVFLTVGYLSSIIRTTLNQTIDGLKKFLQKVTVANANPSFELMDAAGTETEIGQFAGGGASTNDRWIALQQWISGDYKNILKSDKSGKVDFPRGKPSYNGKDLATEEYVQARVKSGTTFLFGQTDFGGGGYAKINGQQQIFALPGSSRIVGFIVTAYESTMDALKYTVNCNIAPNTFSVFIDNSTPTLKLEIREPVEHVFATTISFDLGAQFPYDTSYGVTIILSV